MRRSDELIRDEICKRLAMTPEIEATDVDVIVKDGEVIPRGMVDDRFEKRLVEDRQGGFLRPVFSFSSSITFAQNDKLIIEIAAETERRMETIRQHTSNQKKEASELLFYEVTMLHELSCHMERLLNQNTIAGTAALEAFSVHAKVLHDFFYSKEAAPDVVVAQDFFESSSDWDRVRNVEPELLQLAARRIGDHVATFTYDSAEVVPLLKGWDYCEIATEIHDAFVKFIDAVPVKYLGPHCAEFKHHEREEL